MVSIGVFKVYYPFEVLKNSGFSGENGGNKSIIAKLYCIAEGVDFTVLTGVLPITETWIEGKILSKEIDRTVSNK